MKKRSGREELRQRRARATRRKRKVVFIPIVGNDGRPTAEFLAWADMMLRRG